MNRHDDASAPPDLDGAFSSRTWLPRRFARKAIDAAIGFHNLVSIQPSGNLANPYGRGDARDDQRYHLAINILLTAVQASHGPYTGNKDIAGKFAIIAATELRYLLDWQAPGTLFFTSRQKLADAQQSANYLRACTLLEEALAHVLDSSVGDNAAPAHPATVRCVVPDGAADAPTDVIKLSVDIETALLTFGFKLLNKDRCSSEDSGLLEFSIGGCSQVNKASESIDRQVNAVHSASSGKVVGQSLCHGRDQVDLLMEVAFGPSRVREKRSAAYMEGARSYLELRVTGAELPCRYDTGTAEFDAYFAGLDEGREIWRSQMRKEPA